MSYVLFTGIYIIIGIWVIWCELNVQNEEVPLGYFQYSGCTIVTDLFKRRHSNFFFVVSL